MVCKYLASTDVGVGVMTLKGDSADHDPTVNDSPHPQASLILGFLKTNFELRKCDEDNTICRKIHVDKP